MAKSTNKYHGYIVANGWAYLNPNTDGLFMMPINCGHEIEIQSAPENGKMMGIKLSGQDKLLYVELSSVYIYPQWVVGDNRMGRRAVIQMTEFVLFWYLGKPETLSIWLVNTSPFRPMTENRTGQVLVSEKPDILGIEIETGEVLVQERRMHTKALLGPCGIWCSIVSTVIMIPLIIVSGIFMVYYFCDGYKLEE
ncbi:hypothetical protein V2G26_018285 [Clonostachys chloroleuca]